MTQHSINRVLLFTTILVAVVFSMELSFMNAQLIGTLHYEYMQEMLRRAAYCTTMLSWVGTADYIIRNIDAGFYYLADSPFVVGISAVKGTDSLEAEGTYPYKAKCYDKRLDGMVSVQESFKAPPKLGCTSDTFCSGACFAIMAIVLMWTFVKGGNLVAQRFPSKRWIARVLVVVGLLCPVLMAVGMQVLVTQVQMRCLERTWADDASRTVELVGDMFQLVTLGMGADGQALFGPTMQLMNDNLITDGRYGFTSITNAAEELVPDIPRTPQSVLDVLYAHTSDVASMSKYYPKAHTFLATFSVPSMDMLIVLIHMVDNAMMKFKDAPVVAGFLMLLVPLVPLFILDVVVFPYASLGKVSPDVSEMNKVGNLSPWVWRVSKRWPLWKVFHLATVVAMMVGVTFVYNERLSQYFNIVRGYVMTFDEKVHDANMLQLLGVNQLKNMVNLMCNFVWYQGYIEYLDGVSNKLGLMEIALFYEKVAIALRSDRYEGLSNAWTLGNELQSQYPVLANSGLGELVSETMNDPVDSEKGTEYSAFMYTWDMMFLRAVLMNDVALLETGDTVSAQFLEDNAGLIGKTASQVQQLIQMVVLAHSPYLTIAEGFLKAVDSQVVEHLMQGEEGRSIVNIENTAINNLNPEDLTSYVLSLVYIWSNFRSTDFAIACVVVCGFALLFDLFYTGAFFGLSDGAKSALRHARFLPSNDYTSPNPYLEVNHRRLWFSAFLSYAYTLIVTVVCVVAIIASNALAEEFTNDLMNVVSADIHLTRGDGFTVFNACPIAASAAYWLRTYLSLDNADVINAVRMTMFWTSTETTTFVGGEPDASVSVNDVRTREEIVDMSGIVAALRLEATNGFTSQYKDFSAFLGEFTQYYNFADIPGCLPTHEMVEMSHGLYLLFSSFITNDAALGQEAQDMLLMSLGIAAGSCGVAADFETYMIRLVALSQRAWYYENNEKLAEDMYIATMESTRGIDSSVRVVQSEFNNNQKSIEDFPVPWIAMLSAWVCTPFLYLLYRETRSMHDAMYHV